MRKYYNIDKFSFKTITLLCSCSKVQLTSLIQTARDYGEPFCLYQNLLVLVSHKPKILGFYVSTLLGNALPSRIKYINYHSYLKQKKECTNDK